MSKTKRLILLYLVIALLIFSVATVFVLTGHESGSVISDALIIYGLMFFTIFVHRRHYLLAKRANEAYLNKKYDMAYDLYEKAITMPKCPEEIKVEYAYKLMDQGHLERAQKVIETINEDTLNAEGKMDTLLKLKDAIKNNVDRIES